MTEHRPGHGGRSALPADAVPSAEVLDELLRAFSADGTDRRTLDEIDLASPEVAELLAPTSPTPPPSAPTTPAADPSVDPQPALELEGEATDSSEAAPDVEGDDEADLSNDAGSDDRPDAAVPVDRTQEPEPAPPPGDVPASAPPTEDPSAPSGTRRTIRIDASDDPPDAVYLAAGDPLLAASAGGRAVSHRTSDADADAGAAPSETTVFIDDQAIGAGDTITLAEASQATQIEPRLRERRIAVKRAVGRKRLRWVFVALAVVVALVAALAVLGSGLFAIDEVRVDGAVHADPEALQAVVDELEGTPVLRADTDRAERELEAIPWVADARVHTRFPNRATIELRERAPVAVFQGPDQRFRVIDIEARVLEVLDAQPVEETLVVSPEAADLGPGQFAAQGFVAAANLLTALTPELQAVAGSVKVTANGSDLRLLLTDGREVRFGPGRDLVTKLVRLQTKLDDLQSGGFQYVDVSTNEITTG